MNELDSALLGISDVAEHISGEVTIACVPSAVAYFLPGVMRTYHRKYPGIRIRVIDESSSIFFSMCCAVKPILGSPTSAHKKPT